MCFCCCCRRRCRCYCWCSVIFFSFFSLPILVRCKRWARVSSINTRYIDSIYTDRCAFIDLGSSILFFFSSVFHTQQFIYDLCMRINNNAIFVVIRFICAVRCEQFKQILDTSSVCDLILKCIFKPLSSLHRHWIRTFKHTHTHLRALALARIVINLENCVVRNEKSIKSGC